MDFSDLKTLIKPVRFDALRLDCDNYFEAVILKEELAKLTVRLENFFGTPAWPSKERLSFSVQEKIRGFGGIMPGQTLYYRRKENDTVFAMLWPWKDGERVTVKIIQE